MSDRSLLENPQTRSARNQRRAWLIIALVLAALVIAAQSGLIERAERWLLTSGAPKTDRPAAPNRPVPVPAPAPKPIPAPEPSAAEPPVPSPSHAPAPPVKPAPKPAAKPRPKPPAPAVPENSSQASTPRAYRQDAARLIYEKNAARIYKGKLPPLLYAIGVLQVNIDEQGRVRSLNWMRAPHHAPEVIREIERTVRAAAPYPAPTRMGSVVYTDTWLWHKSGKFQLDTLTEGQL